MTDLEKFKELYKSFGIELIVNKNEEKNIFEVFLHEGSYSDKTHTLSNKFTGYIGFYSFIEFDINEKFIQQGFAE